MHRYTVRLQIVGQALNPEEVTRTLGLMPTQARRKGEPKVEGTTRKWTANMWAFEVLPQGRDDWSSLGDALATALSAFSPVRDKVRAYSATNQVYLWCGHFTSSFDGGPTLSPDLLRSLADFGVQLVLDTYCERADDVSAQSEDVAVRS
jgi:hypothetical protein